MHDLEPELPPPPRNNPARKPSVWLFIARALRLRCPECGISPMFVPARRVRSIWDWFTPLDGCPRCGYAYERERGYFLMATWAVNYGVVAGLGMIVALVVDHYFQPPLWKLIAIGAIPMPF